MGSLLILKDFWKLPNLLSFFRIVVAILLPFLLQKNYHTYAFTLFLCACITDWMDGYIARKWQQESHLGALIDPLADKILLISIYICGSYFGFLPVWLTSIVLLRDILILSGSYIAIKYNFSINLSPYIISKINTLLQMILALGVMGHFIFPFSQKLIFLFVQGIGTLIIITTVWSGSYYINRFKKGLKKLTHEK